MSAIHSACRSKMLLNDLYSTKVTFQAFNCDVCPSRGTDLGLCFVSFMHVWGILNIQSGSFSAAENTSSHHTVTSTDCDLKVGLTDTMWINQKNVLCGPVCFLPALITWQEKDLILEEEKFVEQPCEKNNYFYFKCLGWNDSAWFTAFSRSDWSVHKSLRGNVISTEQRQTVLCCV